MKIKDTDAKILLNPLRIVYGLPQYKIVLELLPGKIKELSGKQDDTLYHQSFSNGRTVKLYLQDYKNGKNSAPVYISETTEIFMNHSWDKFHHKQHFACDSKLPQSLKNNAENTIPNYKSLMPVAMDFSSVKKQYQNITAIKDLKNKTKWTATDKKTGQNVQFYTNINGKIDGVFLRQYQILPYGTHLPTLHIYENGILASEYVGALSGTASEPMHFTTKIVFSDKSVLKYRNTNYREYTRAGKIAKYNPKYVLTEEFSPNSHQEYFPSGGIKILRTPGKRETFSDTNPQTAKKTEVYLDGISDVLFEQYVSDGFIELSDDNALKNRLETEFQTEKLLNFAISNVCPDLEKDIDIRHLPALKTQQKECDDLAKRLIKYSMARGADFKIPLDFDAEKLRKMKTVFPEIKIDTIHLNPKPKDDVNKMDFWTSALYNLVRPLLTEDNKNKFLKKQTQLRKKFGRVANFFSREWNGDIPSAMMMLYCDFENRKFFSDKIMENTKSETIKTIETNGYGHYNEEYSEYEKRPIWGTCGDGLNTAVTHTEYMTGWFKKSRKVDDNHGKTIQDFKKQFPELFIRNNIQNTI